MSSFSSCEANPYNELLIELVWQRDAAGTAVYYCDFIAILYLHD